MPKYLIEVIRQALTDNAQYYSDKQDLINFVQRHVQRKYSRWHTIAHYEVEAIYNDM